ncbi:MAG: hypothetical protein WCH93_02990 [Actinomycetota bacterium]
MIGFSGKESLGVIAAATATTGAFAFAPSANAAPQPKIGNTTPTPGVPMVWNCMQ